MKKVLSLILCLCLLASCLAGCEFKSTFQIITEAVEKTRTLDSVAVVMDMKVDLSTEGMSLSVPITADIKASGLQSEAPVSRSIVTTSFMGQELDVDMYQEGDWAYLSMAGMNMKMNMAEAKTENEYDYTDDMANLIQALPEDILKDLELTKNKDGSLSITVLLSGEAFTQLYGELLADMNATAGVDAGVETTVKDATVSITMAGGYITRYDVTFGTTTTVQGLAAECSFAVGIRYTDPGTPVTVTPPEGYQDYTDLTPKT